MLDVDLGYRINVILCVSVTVCVDMRVLV